jgi:hypothetical protein
MALARCEDCGQPQRRRRNTYVSFHLPWGYAETGVARGSTRCEKPAKVWLVPQEEAQYQRGIRVFPLPTQAAKARLKQTD